MIFDALGLIIKWIIHPKQTFLKIKASLAKRIRNAQIFNHFEVYNFGTLLYFAGARAFERTRQRFWTNRGQHTSTHTPAPRRENRSRDLGDLEGGLDTIEIDNIRRGEDIDNPL